MALAWRRPVELGFARAATGANADRAPGQASEAHEATCRKVSGAPAAREEPQEPWVRERGIGKVNRRIDSATIERAFGFIATLDSGTDAE